MASTLHYYGVLPTLEQEAPDVPNPTRAVEVFSDDMTTFLRVGPVEGLDEVHGSYTLKLAPADLQALVDALGRAKAAR